MDGCWYVIILRLSVHIIIHMCVLYVAFNTVFNTNRYLNISWVLIVKYVFTSGTEQQVVFYSN